jgi:hypothetical protein
LTFIAWKPHRGYVDITAKRLVEKIRGVGGTSLASKGRKRSGLVTVRTGDFGFLMCPGGPAGIPSFPSGFTAGFPNTLPFFMIAIHAQIALDHFSGLW